MTKRTYGQGRTARAPEARMTPEALEALKMLLDKDGASYADWLEAKITEDSKMTITEVLEITVKDAEGNTGTVQQFRNAYQRAHPTYTIIVKDEGKQVFVGNVYGTGINLDKVK